LCGVTVTIEVALDPATKLTGVEALTVKSGIVVEVNVNVVVAVWLSEGPLAPVMVTGYDPATVDVHDSDECPDPVTVAGLNAWQFRPLGSGVSESVTVPAKPLSGFTIMVEVAGLVPSAGEGGGGAAMIVKSGMLAVTSTMSPVSLMSGQLVPLIATK
jgi:hypothetical protein